MTKQLREIGKASAHTGYQKLADSPLFRWLGRTETLISAFIDQFAAATIRKQGHYLWGLKKTSHRAGTRIWSALGYLMSCKF